MVTVEPLHASITMERAENADVPDVKGGGTTTGQRPFIAKRPHKKSRAGCTNCKKRKVKCDEARPRCRACTMRKEACVYPSLPASSTPPAPTTVCSAASAEPSPPSLSSSLLTSASVSLVATSNNQQQPQRPAATLATRCVNSVTTVSRGFSADPNGFTLLAEPLVRPVDIDETDLRLLWFYTAKGYDAFFPQTNRESKINEILQVTIPRYAFANRFLMDSLLALAALELQQIGQTIDPARVLMYRARAFSGYRTAIEKAQPETFPALLACSLLLCVLSSQMFRDADARQLYIVDWMVVWRGIGLIVEIIRPQTLYDSGLALLFARPSIDLEASTSNIPNQLLFMITFIQPDDPDYQHVSVYYETLKYLGSLYRELEAGIGRVLNLRVITWFTFLPKGFVELARRHRPRALAIIAHYLVFIKLCKYVWWARGIADKEIQDISNLLGDEWRPFLKAPGAALCTEDDVKLGKILLENQNWTPAYQYSDKEANNYVFVDDAGFVVEYNGEWVRADDHTPAVWNIHDT